VPKRGAVEITEESPFFHLSALLLFGSRQCHDLGIPSVGPVGEISEIRIEATAIQVHAVTNDSEEFLGPRLLLVGLDDLALQPNPFGVRAGPEGKAPGGRGPR
jgi:hypothetical protein